MPLFKRGRGGKSARGGGRVPHLALRAVAIAGRCAAHQTALPGGRCPPCRGAATPCQRRPCSKLAAVWARRRSECWPAGRAARWPRPAIAPALKFKTWPTQVPNSTGASSSSLMKRQARHSHALGIEEARWARMLQVRAGALSLLAPAPRRLHVMLAMSMVAFRGLVVPVDLEWKTLKTCRENRMMNDAKS